VVVGQSTKACRSVQDACGVVTGRLEGVQLGGEDGQSRVGGEGGDGLDDAWGPFPDAGFGGQEPVVEVVLGVALCQGPASWPCRPQVTVGDAVGGSPQPDVVDESGVEFGQVLCPGGRLGIDRSQGLLGELLGEVVPGGEVCRPFRVVEQLGGDVG